LEVNKNEGREIDYTGMTSSININEIEVSILGNGAGLYFEEEDKSIKISETISFLQHLRHSSHSNVKQIALTA
jgi:hypothetical protein